MRGFVVILVIGTLISGAANSLFTKYQDNQCVRNCSSPDVSTHVNFEQPALQTMQMFIGELGMLLVFMLMYRTRLFARKTDYIAIDTQGEEEERSISLFSNAKLAAPAVCDLLATTLLNVGLLYTPVSIYQMTRGSLVLFVAILSVLFLKRRVTKLEWISLSLVTLGVALVGISGSSNSDDVEAEASSAGLVLFGMGLIVVAEIVQAFQFVVEEQILSEKAIIPIKLVYCEGFYGAVILLVATVVLNFVIGATSPPEEFLKSSFNIQEALRQMFYSPSIWGSSLCIMVSISAFNFFGISITKSLSATSRSTVDTCRTFLVWTVAIVMGWEKFHMLQFVGFLVLVFGTLCFNKVLTPEEWKWVPRALKE